MSNWRKFCRWGCKKLGFSLDTYMRIAMPPQRMALKMISFYRWRVRKPVILTWRVLTGHYVTADNKKVMREVWDCFQWH